MSSAFQLELQCRAECEFLTGQLAAAEERLIVSFSVARVADTGRASPRSTHACARICTPTLNQSDRAVAVCLGIPPRMWDIEWTAHPYRRGSTPAI